MKCSWPSETLNIYSATKTINHTTKISIECADLELRSHSNICTIEFNNTFLFSLFCTIVNKWKSILLNLLIGFTVSISLKIMMKQWLLPQRNSISFWNNNHHSNSFQIVNMCRKAGDFTWRKWCISVWPADCYYGSKRSRKKYIAKYIGRICVSIRI